MLSCVKSSRAVILLFIFLAFSFSGYAEIKIPSAKQTLKIVSQELWESGVLSQELEKPSESDQKNVLYFPEELEVALRMIDS